MITGIHTVGVPVGDQDRALEFYVGTLGLDKRLDAPVPQLGGRWIEVAPRGAATTVALLPGGEPGVETGIRLTVDDAAKAHAELRAKGVDVGELLLWEGVPPMFALRDPDGNGLEIVEGGAR
ncbi:VOC family protein [Thermoactinospora rubra]|uniref:VOC family protein n=1 Tax=Thermoactinospora rubra TaxID=1088767 RepID=UPI000A109AD0|nr:VOC family protein [Thermoactinospora rubra]